MCTVTYIPVKDTIFFTSNRDEKSWRRSALPPAIYEYSSGKIMFPKDSDAGGTWIAAHENGNVVVFLNGGFKAHVPEPPYRKSRGLILLDIIENTTPVNCFTAINLNRIEPFTAVLWDNKQLFECRWDGAQKHCSELDAAANYIWSSVTLYDDQVIAKRKSWFDDFLNATPQPEQSEILGFHQFTGDGDTCNDLLMNREGKVGTVSITSVEIPPTSIEMNYLDVRNNESFSEVMVFESSIAGR